MELTLETRTKVNNIFKSVQKNMIYLYERWLDEKEYEDIKDYAKAITPKLGELGATLVKATKRPFGFHIKVDGNTFHLFVNATTYGWKQVL